MTFRAAFAEVAITPPVGTHKIGWLRDITSDQVLDPLYARVAAFSDGRSSVGFVQLDWLSVRWTTAAEMRRAIKKAHGFPGENVLVSATHNHAGPAVCGCGETPRDDAYVADAVAKVVAAFGEALSRMEDAEVGFDHVCEWRVAHNRRVVMRDGTARTHGTFEDPNALYVEGPIDPEVAVVAARSRRTGKLLGAIVNFACHPTHFGGGTAISAGFPGVMARELQSRGCPVALYLNGPCGNIHHAIPETAGNVEMDEAGRTLADDAEAAMVKMAFSGEAALSARSTTVQLPYRDARADEVAGTIRGAQRFVDPKIYDRGMPALLERIKTRKVQPAEVQVVRVGEAFFTSIPAEYFVEFGLRIKTEAHPRRALVVSLANGCVGYVPTPEAFQRGGYETTFAASSRMAPEAGDILADAAIRLIREM